MTIEVANSLYRYFKGLYELNQHIIALCGADVVEDDNSYDVQFENIIHLVPKLIPYKYDPKKEKYVIEQNDGLLEFTKELPFLKEDYEHTLENHYTFLKNIKSIRNKLEHKMHGTKVQALGNGTLRLFEIIYTINKHNIRITAEELLSFIKEINIIFSKIQMQVVQFAQKEDKYSYPYYKRLTRFYFKDFNHLYKSDLLKLFSKILLPF